MRGKHFRSGMGAAFWRLWLAATGSSLGDGLVLVAFPLLAVSLTTNPLAIAGVAIAGRLPIFVFSLPAGALADRFDRRSLLLVVELLRLVVLSWFASTVLLGHDSLGLIYSTVALLACCQAVFQAARTASVPSVVSRDDLVRANSRLTVSDVTASEVAGQSAGGVAFAVARALPFAADALSFALSAILLRRALPRLPARRAGTSFLADIRYGVVWFAHHRILRLLAALVGSFALCQWIMMSVLVLYGTRELSLSGAEYGALLAVGAVGSLLGALLASRVDASLGAGRTIVIAGVAAGGAYVALAVSNSVLLAGLALMVESTGISLGNISSISLRQRLIPNHLFGRVLSTFRMTLYGAMPLGALVGGLLSTRIGIRPTFLVAGTTQLCLLALVGPRLIARIGYRADRVDGVQGEGLPPDDKTQVGEQTQQTPAVPRPNAEPAQGGLTGSAPDQALSVPAAVPPAPTPAVSTPAAAPFPTVASMEVPGPAGSWDLDVAAAMVRSEGSDVDRLFDVLGEKLARILPSRVQLEREGSRLRRSQRVRKIVVDAGDERLEASRERQGPAFRVAHAVRGITLRTEEVALDAWLELLIQVVSREATKSDEVRTSLGRLLDA